MKIKIGAVVVLFNPDEEVVKNILSYKNEFDSLFLIDNSNKNNYEMFWKIENALYIPLMDNYGIAYALNKGIKLAKENSLPYLVTMDQDSRFYPDAINNYRQHLEKGLPEKWFALTPQYDTDRSSIKKKNGIKKVKLSMQSGSLFSIDAMDHVGEFNEDLFLDVVDWEYFIRGNNLGYSSLRCNDVILIHHPAFTESINLFGITFKYGKASSVRYYYQIRNLYWVYKKTNELFLLIFFFIKWLKIIFLFDNKKKYINMGKKAIIDAKNNKLGKFVEL